MTRILTITSWYPPHHYGGYELSCFDVMTRLVARGHKVRVLCGNERLSDAIDGDPRHEALVYRELKPHRWEATPARPSIRDRIAIERHNRRVVEHHLAEFQPEVVSVWHMAAISMSLIRRLVEARIPIVYVVCDNWLLYGEQQDAWMSLFSGRLPRRILGRLTEAGTGLFTSIGDLGDTGAFCFVSDHIRRRALEREPWSYQCSTVVYSGINSEQFPVVPAQAERKWRGRLLYVGRLDAWKGVDTLLRALTLLPDATLACFGRGGAEERVRLGRVAEELGVSTRVSFGSLERHELAAHYRDADVLIFPSEWDEPFGLVPLEAMACGTPVLATGVGGSAEFLRDGYNCLLFPAANHPELARAVRRLEADVSLRDRITCGGRRTADQLDVCKLADTLEAWHRAAAQRFVAGHPSDRRLDLPPALQSIASGNTPDTSDSDDMFRGLVDRLDGLVLGVRPERNPAESTRGRRRASRTHVSFARSADSRGHTLYPGRAAEGLQVVAELERLPFRDGCFDAIACDRGLERCVDDRRAVAEMGRVLRPLGKALIVSNNRDDASLLRRRARDVVLGVSRPENAYFHSPDNLREYVPARLADLVRPVLLVRCLYAVGWGKGWRGRTLSAIIRLAPFKRLGRATVLHAERRSNV